MSVVTISSSIPVLLPLLCSTPIPSSRSVLHHRIRNIHFNTSCVLPLESNNQSYLTRHPLGVAANIYPTGLRLMPTGLCCCSSSSGAMPLQAPTTSSSPPLPQVYLHLFNIYANIQILFSYSLSSDVIVETKASLSFCPILNIGTSLILLVQSLHELPWIVRYRVSEVCIFA